MGCNTSNVRPLILICGANCMSRERKSFNGEEQKRLYIMVGAELILVLGTSNPLIPLVLSTCGSYYYKQQGFRFFDVRTNKFSGNVPLRLVFESKLHSLIINMVTKNCINLYSIGCTECLENSSCIHTVG